MAGLLRLQEGACVVMHSRRSRCAGEQHDCPYTSVQHERFADLTLAVSNQVTMLLCAATTMALFGFANECVVETDHATGARRSPSHPCLWTHAKQNNLAHVHSVSICGVEKGLPMRCGDIDTWLCLSVGRRHWRADAR